MAIGQIIAKALGGITSKVARAGGRNLTRLQLMARAVSGQRRPPSLGPSSGGLKQAEPQSWIRRLLDRMGGREQAGQAGRDTPGWATRLANAVRNQRMVVDHRDSSGSPGAPEKLTSGLLGQIATAVGSGRPGGGGSGGGGPGAAGATGGRPRSSQTPGGIAAGAAGSIGASAGFAAGAVALGLSNPITAAVSVVAGTLMTLTVAGNSLADSLLESQKGLVVFNSTIAVAYQRMKNEEMKRSFKSAARRAGAVEDLAEKTDKFDESTQELKDLAAIMGMQFGGWIKGLLTTASESLKSLEPIRKAIEEMNRKAKTYEGNPSHDFIKAWAGRNHKNQEPKPRLPQGGGY